MKKKKKKPSLTPKGKKDKKKGLDALKDKNFHLDDEDNDKIRGGFIEYGGGGVGGPGGSQGPEGGSK
ncbi:MAG: hypothetical protein JST68_18615 [Bacteroidetes bacterium]|nr:hypothetical protein [Bacteroidota bacterium]